MRSAVASYWFVHTVEHWGVVGSILRAGSIELFLVPVGVRCSSVVRAFAHGSILHGGPIELFLVPVGARCSSVVRAFAHGSILHGGPIELFLVPVGARCSSVVKRSLMVSDRSFMGWTH